MPPRCIRFRSRTAALLLTLIIGTLSAQEPAPEGGAAPAAPQAPGGGAVVIEQDTSGLIFEWILTTIGVGVAVFVVCRSSRRN